MRLMFNIGDRVVGIGEQDGLDLTGKTGEIVGKRGETVHFNDNYDYGVSFDECDERMHSLFYDGTEHTEYGHGYFCAESVLDLEAPCVEYDIPDLSGLL